MPTLGDTSALLGETVLVIAATSVILVFERSHLLAVCKHASFLPTVRHPILIAIATLAEVMARLLPSLKGPCIDKVVFLVFI